MECSFDKVPKDVIGIIMKLIDDHQTLYAASLTCKRVFFFFFLFFFLLWLWFLNGFLQWNEQIVKFKLFSLLLDPSFFYDFHPWEEWEEEKPKEITEKLLNEVLGVLGLLLSLCECF